MDNDEAPLFSMHFKFDKEYGQWVTYTDDPILTYGDGATAACAAVDFLEHLWEEHEWYIKEIARGKMLAVPHIHEQHARISQLLYNIREEDLYE